MNNKFLTYLCLLYSRHWQALSSTEKSEGQKWEINAALSMPYFFKSLRQRSISVTACNYVILKQFKLSYFMGIDSRYVFMTWVIFVRSIALLTAVKILKVLHLHCRQWVERGFSLKKIWSIRIVSSDFPPIHFYWVYRREGAVDLVLLSIARSKLVVLIDEEKSFAAFKRIS